MKLLAQALTLPGGGQTPVDVTINGPTGFNTKFTSLGNVVSSMVSYLFVFAGIGLLLMLIFGGFQLLTGGTDPKSLEMGKKRITYAIVGFIIVFLAYWGVRLVSMIFGITEFKNIFGA
jgi:small-conductance mechanosensitive channel